MYDTSGLSGEDSRCCWDSTRPLRASYLTSSAPHCGQCVTNSKGLLSGLRIASSTPVILGMISPFLHIDHIVEGAHRAALSGRHCSGRPFHRRTGKLVPARGLPPA